MFTYILNFQNTLIDNLYSNLKVGIEIDFIKASKNDSFAFVKTSILLNPI